jgi:hypothetical protein
MTLEGGNIIDHISRLVLTYMVQGNVQPVDLTGLVYLLKTQSCSYERKLTTNELTKWSRVLHMLMVTQEIAHS